LIKKKLRLRVKDFLSNGVIGQASRKFPKGLADLIKVK